MLLDVERLVIVRVVTNIDKGLVDPQYLSKHQGWWRAPIATV
jgi:hypothetical protein